MGGRRLRGSGTRRPFAIALLRAASLYLCPAICLTVQRENSQLKDVAQVEAPGERGGAAGARGGMALDPPMVIRCMNSAAST
jgi:hypothetical protein